MLKITDFYVDYQRYDAALKYTHEITTEFPVFSWAAESDHPNDKICAAKMTFFDGSMEKTLCDITSSENSVSCIKFDGPEIFTPARPISAVLEITDQYGEIAQFICPELVSTCIKWPAPWIASAKDRPRTQALCFFRQFRIPHPENITAADLYVCGIGYQYVMFNEEALNCQIDRMTYDSLDGRAYSLPLLDPPFTNYSKHCQYVHYPVQDYLLGDEAFIAVNVGLGWRDNFTVSLVDDDAPGKVSFRGDPMLTACFIAHYNDGSILKIVTDDSWLCREAPMRSNDLYRGIVATRPDYISSWGFKEFYKNTTEHAKIVAGPGGAMVPMSIPPILPTRKIAPVAHWPAPQGNGFIYDFGENIAGLIQLHASFLIPQNQKIIVRHSEEIDADGNLYTAPLRQADATDIYEPQCQPSQDDNTSIFDCTEDQNGQLPDPWTFNDLYPFFTYHGFRYASVQGWDDMVESEPHGNRIYAIPISTNLKKHSHFSCGNPLVNQIYENCIRTEESNMHSILTDCPQRNERMGWMNDATVRFEAFPFAFEPVRMFRKIITDIMDEQGPDGAITCTAPFIWGYRPGDPVCSSFLITAKQAYLHCGDKYAIELGYDAFKAWTNCLIAHSDDYIVNYSYYGDWAGPSYACQSDEDAKSAVTPGIFMSTGYSYFNCRTMAEFATILNKQEDADYFTRMAENIKNAMFRKWYDKDTNTFMPGSMACQIFPIWLGIFPEDKIQDAVRRVRDELVASDYKFTTGNLCTRYLFEILTDYGFVDDAWALITRDTYPSFGYMIQQEATTIWERFEQKLNPGMNSHNHPMYGAIYHWFYTRLAGIRILEKGCSKISINPTYPKDLQHVLAVYDSIRGDIYVRWFKRYGKLTLHVCIPIGVEADVTFNGKTQTVGSGFHVFSKDI